MFCSIRVWSLVASKDLFRLSFILFLFGSFRFKLETSSVRSYCFVPDNWRDIILNHFDSIDYKYLLKLLFYNLSTILCMKIIVAIMFYFILTRSTVMFFHVLSHSNIVSFSKDLFLGLFHYISFYSQRLSWQCFFE